MQTLLYFSQKYTLFLQNDTFLTYYYMIIPYYGESGIFVYICENL